MNHPFLHVDEVAKSFGAVCVFEAVTFTVGVGERIAIVGESGAGKSTLLRVIAGLEEPTAGTIKRDPSLRIGMVFQDLALWPNLSALHNVILALPHLNRTARHEAAKAALESCQVGDLATRQPGTLSIGQQQRVALARGIAAQPHLLLLDEPFSSLDLPLKQEVIHHVNQLVQERSMAVVLVTHELMEVELLSCESALVLQDRRLVERGSWASLRETGASRLLDAWRNAWSPAMKTQIGGASGKSLGDLRGRGGV